MGKDGSLSSLMRRRRKRQHQSLTTLRVCPVIYRRAGHLRHPRPEETLEAPRVPQAAGEQRGNIM